MTKSKDKTTTFSYSDLHLYLFTKAPVRPIKIDQLKQKVFQYRNCKRKNIPRLSRALESFPIEVQLCTSSIPCVVYGVCARRYIPIGTWIGPYEGKQFQPNSEALTAKENFYMWEVVSGNHLSHYLDGSNENTSSWMRFIACARNISEQNLYAFQYCGNIYYRAFKDISPGTELLVWYDDNYPQCLGIPLDINDLGNMETDEINAGIPSQPSVSSLINAHKSVHHEVKEGDSFQNISFTRIKPIHQSKLLTNREKTAHASCIKSNDQSTLLPYGLTILGDNCTMPRDTPTLCNMSQQSRDSIHISDTFAEFPGSNQKESNTLRQHCHGDYVNDDEGICEEDDTGTSLFRCGQCDKVFPQRSILQLHICSCAANKPFQCGFCGNAFANPDDLRAHSATHCNEKPFKCGYCSRAFSGATTLNNHIRTHTGEKPFNCQRCGKMFSQGAQLSRHQRIDCRPVTMK